ncbi:baseplate J/gp47 family protein [Bacillus sp. FJAT-45350]|uniref:baseplate J/gp47 family protein n=1 Tax=Bacillus sp. FJAT-45350 TaxID=2011014 RepID=UPI000BB88473|nr:baseplate J/gp47 family protein [Bacillus sp. FJAT-45350]
MDEREKEIHEEILSDIDDSYSKLQGDFIYEATRPPAIQFNKLEKQNENVRNKLDVENLRGEELAKYIFNRTGQERREKTYSIGEVLVEADGTVYVNDLFETESGIQFVATEERTISESGTVKIQAVEPGPIGNVPANRITKIPVTLSGVVSVANPQPTYDGFSAESDADLLQRYYERIRTPATSGNRAHYLIWAKEIAGVGDARAFPLYYGGNTVRVVIIDAEKKPASNDLIEQVQEHIDPGSNGLGDGVAPLGAYCYVEAAVPVTINVDFTVTKEDGYTDEEVIENVSKSLTEYLKSIAFVEGINFVSYAQIGSTILDSTGVFDYTNLIVNGSNVNIDIANDEVAILGGVGIV